MAEPPFDMSALLSQAQRLQQELEAAQERARGLTVEASAGGGLVAATMTGALELRTLKIDPQCADPKELTLLEDLVIAAVNQAIAKAQQAVQDEVKKVAGGLPLPPGLGF